MVVEHGGRRRRVVCKGSGRKDGIKYTLSVKSTLFWDFSMHTVLLKDCICCSLELRRRQDDRAGRYSSGLTSAVRCRGYR